MNNTSGNKWLNSQFGLLLILWIILTAININKAYHIDDTFHLEAAQCILENPMKPMSGFINWDQSPEPMHTFNQPPLFFAVIAATQSVLGNSEVVMHLLISIFTFLALFYFSKLLSFLAIRHKRTFLILFGLCPAFVVNQNLMTDVPVLAISLASMFYLLKGLKEDGYTNYVFSALFLSAGLLIKYSLLPLFCVILLTVVLSKRYKKAIVLLIPISILALWSTWNMMEFDSIHLIDRRKSGLKIDQIVGFLGTLGSMSIFAISYIYFHSTRKNKSQIIILGFLTFGLSVPLVYFGVINEWYFNMILNVFFIANGIALMYWVIRKIIKPFKENKEAYFQSTDFPIALYILGFTSFMILFAPFSATRHILLIFPFLLLISEEQLNKSNGIINKLIVSFTIVSGLLLGASDWMYADFYRSTAQKVEISNDYTTWSIGHWGWQWYSKKQGMEIYAKDNEMNVRTGDVIVFPGDVAKQELSPYIEIDTIKSMTESPNFLTFFSGKKYASMYNSYILKPAWRLSNIPIDTIFVCRVTKEIGIEDIMVEIKSDDKWLDSLTQIAIEKELPLDSIIASDATHIMNKKRVNN